MTSFRPLFISLALLLGGGCLAAEQRVEQGAEQTAEPTKPPVPRLLRGSDQTIQAPKPHAKADGAAVSFNFEEAPVADVVRTILGDILKGDYMLHPPLSGTVTLATSKPVEPDEALFLLEVALQTNGLGLVRDARGNYHIGRPDVLKGIGSSVRLAGGGPLPPGFGAIIVPLQYIGAAEMATILRPMLQPDALVKVDSVRNLLVLAGTRAQAEGWLELVATFDVDLLKGMSVGVFPLKHATIKEVETALRLVSGAPAQAAATAGPAAGAQTQATNQAGTASANLGEGNPLFGALRIMPIERLNSILVVTPRAAYLDQARAWIEKLDQPGDNGGEPQLFIYQVRHGSAKHLASVLAGIFGTQGTASGTTPNSGVAPGLTANTLSTGLGVGGTLGNTTANRGAGTQTSTLANSAAARTQAAGNTAPTLVANLGSIRVMPDELNNSVLIWGTRPEFSKIEATLKRLDLPLTQVLIEASIIEVTLNDELQYGLQWAFSDKRASGDVGSGRISGLASGALGGVGQGFSYSLANSLGTVKAVINALATKSLVKMISNPSLMVLDNHTATISVGNQTPVRTSTTTYADNGTTTPPITSTIQYKDTGVSLVVTPSVNASNVVTMQIDQTVTDVGEEDKVSGQRAFLQRQIGSKVAVRSGEAIVLGGLIKDNATTGKNGVPVLQDIPLIGNLFGTNSSIGARTELLVIITPRVVRSDHDVREVSNDLRDRMRGLKVLDPRETLNTKPPGQDAKVFQ